MPHDYIFSKEIGIACCRVLIIRATSLYGVRESLNCHMLRRLEAKTMVESDFDISKDSLTIGII